MQNVFQGLPKRTVFAHIEGEPREFGVSTEIVGEIMEAHLGAETELAKKLETFDNGVMYYVPYAVFALSDEDGIVQYINQFIDEKVTSHKKY